MKSSATVHRREVGHDLVVVAVAAVYPMQDNLEQHGLTRTTEGGTTKMTGRSIKDERTKEGGLMINSPQTDTIDETKIGESILARPG